MYFKAKRNKIKTTAEAQSKYSNMNKKMFKHFFSVFNVFKLPCLLDMEILYAAKIDIGFSTIVNVLEKPFPILYHYLCPIF